MGTSIAERRRGHQLNGVLLFGAAEDLVDRGSYFTLGIQSKILQDAPTFVKPPEATGHATIFVEDQSKDLEGAQR